ncbi:EamA family transporter [Streptomyces lanatus]|uniref:EamA family transporter n=1 Tax=Streptomyces lanatus TaxID=66900 RepID=A0ABV1Y638_9ACTN
MISVVAGLCAAVVFAISTVAASEVARRVGPFAGSAWVMFVGLVVVVPVLLIGGGPAPRGGTLLMMLLVGLAMLAGLLIVYAALRDGAVSMVVPIVSAEGTVTAAIAWAAGEVPSPAKLFGMLLVSASVVTLVALASPAHDGRRTRDRRAALMAAAGCIVCGAMFFGQGHLGGEVSLAWAVLPGRAVPVIALAGPLAATGRLRIDRSTLVLAVVAGVADVLAMALLVLGSRQDVAVTAVLVSQYAVVAILIAAWLFGEKLKKSQMWAVAGLAVGVALIAISSG